MKPVEVRAQIKAGQTGPLYLLTGDDLQSRHDLALEFAAVVDEGLQAFNVESFYGNEAGSASARDQMMGAIVSTSRTLPMMAPRRIVIVHEAEKLLSPRKAADEDAETLPEVHTGGRKKRGSTTPAEDLEWIAARRLHHPIGTLEQPLKLRQGPLTLPRDYILCTKSETFRRYADQARADGWPTHELDASHNPHITVPGELMTLLDRIVQAPTAEA